jgi:hypothetical protein
MKSVCVYDEFWDVIAWESSDQCETGQVCVEQTDGVGCEPDPSAEYQCSELDATRCRPDASIGDHAVERCQVVAPANELVWWLERPCSGDGVCEERDGGARCAGPGEPGDRCDVMDATRCRPDSLDGLDAVEACEFLPGMGGELAWWVLDVCAECPSEPCACEERDGRAQCVSVGN